MHAILPLFIGFIAKMHSYDFVNSSYHVNKIEQNSDGCFLFPLVWAVDFRRL